MTMMFSIATFIVPKTASLDPILTLVGITYIIFFNWDTFTTCFNILQMKAGSGSELNKIKLEILKISLVDEIDDIRIISMTNNKKALIGHFKLNRKSRIEIKKEGYTYV